MPAAPHRRVADDLRHRLARGEWQPGDRLPTQRTLAAEYRVDRGVVQRAVALLRSEGALQGLPRSRVQVPEAAAVRELTDPAAPWPHDVEPVAVEAITADHRLAVELDVQPGAPVLRERVEWLEPDGRPAALRDWHTAAGRGAPVRAGQSAVYARPAAVDEAQVLGLPAGAVVLAVRTVHVDVGGEPAGVVVLVLPADRWGVRLTPEM